MNFSKFHSKNYNLKLNIKKEFITKKLQQYIFVFFNNYIKIIKYKY